MLTVKASALCTLLVLRDWSDESHILSMAALREKLSSIYGLELDRRTVYAAIDTLEDAGFDISGFEDNGIGYYLREREFDSAEVRLLIDAVYAFEYISPRQTDELVDKLKKLQSVYERKAHAPIIRTDKKSPNQQVFLNIEILSEAIEKRKKVSFIYLDYDFDKKLKPRRSERYVVNPYSLICESERYYLVLISSGHSDPSFYRIDMMQDIRILDEPIDISPKDARLDSAKKVVYAHTGEPETIRLLCDKTVLRYVIERFGTDVTIIPKSQTSFEAVFKAAPEGLIYWALQYLQHVEVLAPESVREAVIAAIRNNRYF